MNQNQRRKTLIAEAIANNPEVQQARKLILTLSIVLVSCRAIQILFEALAEEFMVVTINLFTTVILCLFLIAIYQGIKAMAILPLIGSVFSLFKAMGDGIILFLFQTGDIIAISYAFILLASMVMQGVFMIIFLTNSKCREYYKIIEGIGAQVKSEFSRPIS